MSSACCVASRAPPTRRHGVYRNPTASSGWACLLAQQPNPLRSPAPRQQQRHPRPGSQRAGVPVLALDAAFPFDREAQLRQQHSQQGKLRIGMVGFGTFGQFLAERMVKAGHEVIATSRSPYHDVAEAMGVRYYTDPNDFCEEHPDVVMLATSILSLQQVLGALPVQRLRRNTLFVDVLSVKEFPKRLLLRTLPPEMDILCTHPMFGPDSGKGSWSGLNLQYERVRISTGEDRQRRCDTLLQFFEKEGCNMVEMSCEEHDQMAASTQFITHTVGRMLGAMQLQATPIDTRGFQSLLSLVDNTANDSFELYYGLFMYNQNSTEQLDRLEKAFDEVKARLLRQLHDKVRQQLFNGDHAGTQQAPAVPAAKTNGVAKKVAVEQEKVGAASGVNGSRNGTVTASRPSSVDTRTPESS